VTAALGVSANGAFCNLPLMLETVGLALHQHSRLLGTLSAGRPPQLGPVPHPTAAIIVFLVAAETRAIPVTLRASDWRSEPIERGPALPYHPQTY
jgi:hypothetical protein